MNDPAIQRSAAWADARDAAEYDVPPAGEGATVIDLALARLDGLRSSMIQSPHEIGTWSLEYLGPGFHVQLRIARRQRQARLDGWISPAQPIKVFLSTLLRKPLVLEAQVSESGRFEFPVAPTGACRMSFVTEGRGRPPATPPFWI